MHEPEPSGGAREELEKRMYRSSLRQIVKFLNTTLPPVCVSEESSTEEPPREASKEAPKEKRPLKARRLGIYKVRDTKKKTRALVEDAGGYSVRAVTPTRVKKTVEKETAAPAARKKRINKYSELKYNDIKEKNRRSRKPPSKPDGAD